VAIVCFAALLAAYFIFRRHSSFAVRDGAAAAGGIALFIGIALLASWIAGP
jgi:hypothetical protein